MYILMFLLCASCIFAKHIQYKVWRTSTLFALVPDIHMVGL